MIDNTNNEEYNVELNLSLAEQKAQAKKSRGKGRPPRHWLKTLRNPVQADYDTLALLCSKAILARQKFIDVILPFNYRKMSKGLPRASVLKFDTWSTTLRFNARMLLDYIYEIGKTNINSTKLGKEIQAFNAMNARLDALSWAIDGELLKELDEMTKEKF